MSEWKEMILEECIDIKHGYAFKGENITNESSDIVLVTPGNFHVGGGFKASKFKFYNGHIPDEYIFKGGEIVVTMTDLSKESDTLGYSAKIPKDNNTYLHNQRIGLVKFLNDEVFPDYIYWLLRTREYQWFIVGSASGTSVMHTSPSRIKEFSFRCPPLPEQKAIAGVLSSLDDKIDLLHRQNKTLEAMAETLFRQWFIEEAADDWEEVTLGQFFPITTGKKDANFSTIDGIYPFFTCSQKSLMAPDYSFEGKAILLAGNGDFNIKRYSGKFEAYQRTYVLIPYEDKYFNFLYTLMKLNLQKITSAYQGSVIRFITKGMISDYAFKFPTFYVDDKLSILDSIYNRYDDNINSISLLNIIRDTSLPKLMSGEVRVKYDKK